MKPWVSYKFAPKDVSADEIYKFLTAHWHHHNQLSWNKLNILFIFESAILAATWQLGVNRPGMVCSILIWAMLTVYCLLQLMLRDWQVREYCAKKLDRVHEPLKIRMIPGPTGSAVRGQHLLNYLVLLIAVMNITVAWLSQCGIYGSK